MNENYIDKRELQRSEITKSIVEVSKKKRPSEEEIIKFEIEQTDFQDGLITLKLFLLCSLKNK